MAHPHLIVVPSLMRHIVYYITWPINRPMLHYDVGRYYVWVEQAVKQDWEQRMLDQVLMEGISSPKSDMDVIWGYWWILLHTAKHETDAWLCITSGHMCILQSLPHSVSRGYQKALQITWRVVWFLTSTHTMKKRREGQKVEIKKIRLYTYIHT